MQSVLQLIEKTVVENLFSASAPFSGLEKVGQFLCVLSAVIMVVGFIFLIYGAHTWLSIQYSKDTASFFTGAICIALSTVISSALLAATYYNKISVRKYQKKMTDKIESFLSTFEDEFGDPIRENPKTALMIAAIVGFLAKDRLFEHHKKI